MVSSPLQGARLVKELKEHSVQLQASISDLQKAYRELDQARIAVERSNRFIESVIASMSDAFAVVDNQVRVPKILARLIPEILAPLREGQNGEKAGVQAEVG